MKRTIGVFIGDASRRVGTLRFDSQGARQSAAFEYDRQWLAASDRFALEPDLPLVAGAYFMAP
jgi:serine/threonine-protein kinase HipA